VSNFQRDLQRYIAITAIGPSALRSQGAPGVISAAREFLASLPLSPFGTHDAREFTARLNATTLRLQAAFPRPARHWGAARKAINLFLRDACYNVYLRETHDLAKAEPWLELPLDAVGARELRRVLGRVVPVWPGLKHLPPEMSLTYQREASALAEQRQIARVHLDVSLWVRGRPG